MDFLPEKLSEYKGLCYDLVRTIENGTAFKTFTSEIEALNASLAIRELMGMDNAYLIKKLDDIRNRELKRLEALWEDYKKITANMILYYSLN